MANTQDSEQTVRLAIRRRLTATDDETHTVEATVHCPIKGCAVSTDWCERCPRYLRELEEGGHLALECVVPAPGVDTKARCGELLSPEVTCLDAELDAARALALMALAGVTSAPVLDDNSVLIGMVTASALARLHGERVELDFGPGLEDRVEVEDAMTMEFETLSQRATLGEAARLMAEHQLDRVPVVTDDGHLVGVLSAMDLVRWLAAWAP